MQKVLITGGAGFVGSNLIKMILKECSPEQILVIDNLLSSERGNLSKDERVDFICGSIADDHVLAQIDDEFEYIFHLCTYHGNQSSIHDPIADFWNNNITTLKLLNHVKEFKNIKKIVYSAAGCAVAKKTFDSPQATKEDAAIGVLHDSPYSISKLVGEFYAAYFHKQHSTPTVRARFQNVYGPGEVLGAGRWRGTPATIWRNVTPAFIYKALKGIALPLENEGLGSRDFIYVDDICKGLILCALKGATGDVYNLSSGKENKIVELASIINKITNNKGGVELKPRRDWDTSGCRYGCAEKSKAELGFETSVELEEGLQKTIEWTRENIDLIEKNIEKYAWRLDL